ncbi:MAG: hypothetical protein IAE79_26855 [Anaerolinea sp.]|nr:hypothetical protein [Anaerolinea sp.]
MYLETISLLATIILALAGYLSTYWNDLRLTKRQEKLDLVNKRISEFYGPLFVATHTSGKAYHALLQKLGKRAVFTDETAPATERDIVEWRIWVKTVFMPNNLLMEKLIVDKAYLIREEQMPDCLLEFITHVSGYKAVIEKWNTGDFSENVSTDFPEELITYATQSYRDLKAQQLQLIGNNVDKSLQTRLD